MPKIFIPFIDGLINYDCKACGYHCCKHGCVGVNAREKRIVLNKFPFLKYSLVEKENKLYFMRKFQGCLFLEKDGYCSIQKDHSYAVKPFVCRIHPFYLAPCRGEYMVMPSFCDTFFVNDKVDTQVNVNTTHARIIKNAVEAIGYNYFPEETSFTGKRLSLEKKILSDSKQFLNNRDYLDFAAHQLSLSAGNESLVKARSVLMDSVVLWKTFLGIEISTDNPVRTRELTAFTSLLRVGSPLLSKMAEKEVPLLLLAVYVYTALLLKDRKIKAYLTTYRDVLNDFALGLALLKKEDLNIGGRSVEERMNYLRQLQRLYLQILVKPC